MTRVLTTAERARVCPIPKQCWWNALRAAKLFARRKRIVVRYVEGYAVMTIAPVPFSHGWMEVDGEVVETTTDKPAAAYFPGVRYDPKTTRSRPAMPLTLNTRDPGMVAARAAAHAHVLRLTEAEVTAFPEPLDAQYRADLAAIDHAALDVADDDPVFRLVARACARVEYAVAA